VADLTKAFTEGDVVKVIVLKVDVAKKRLSLGMKPSYFTVSPFPKTQQLFWHFAPFPPPAKNISSLFQRFSAFVTG